MFNHKLIIHNIFLSLSEHQKWVFHCFIRLFCTNIKTKNRHFSKKLPVILLFLPVAISSCEFQYFFQCQLSKTVWTIMVLFQRKIKIFWYMTVLMCFCLHDQLLFELVSVTTVWLFRNTTRTRKNSQDRNQYKVLVIISLRALDL